jgi:hypothetical protein
VELFIECDGVRRSGFFLLTLLCLLAHADGRASADETEFEASFEDEDIAAGELGSTEDDAPVRSRRVRGQPRSPPRFVVDPSSRFAIAHRFAKDLSAEIYTRGQLGAVTDPLSTRSSTAALGIIVNKSFGGLVWSNSYEHALHFRDFYGPQSSTTDEVATALARPIKFGNSPWSVTPRVAVAYRFTDNTRSEHSKIELMAPIGYKLTDKTELTLTPRVDLQSYTKRDDGRRDVTGYIAVGVKHSLGKGLVMGLSLGYESRSSNVGSFNHTRLKLAPQLNLRAEF